jgi:DNA-binding XRE family transcriptional regulator
MSSAYAEPPLAVSRPELRALLDSLDGRREVHLSGAAQPPACGALYYAGVNVLRRALAGQHVAPDEASALVTASCEYRDWWSARGEADPYPEWRAHWEDVFRRLADQLAAEWPLRGQLSFGAYLRQLRERAGFSRREVAKALGVDPHTVYRWEHDRSVPSVEHLRAKAALFGRPITLLPNGDTVGPES